MSAKDYTKNVKFRADAYIERVCINKNIQFDAKVIWKRSNNKSETKSVHHKNGYSVFNQTISLPLNMPFNEATEKYEDKNTQFSVLITLKGQQKSGGVAKFNISEILNDGKQKVKQSLTLSKCPDPNAFIEVVFSFEKLEGQQDANQLSMLNASTNQLSLSRIEFNDDKASLEIERINQTVRKIEQLTLKAESKLKQSNKRRASASNENLQQISKKCEKVQNEKTILKTAILNLQESLLKKSAQLKQQKRKFEQQIQDLQYQLHKRDQLQSMKTKQTKDEDSQAGQKYKQLYERSLKQIHDLKSRADVNDRKSIDFNKMMASNLQQDFKQGTNFSRVQIAQDDKAQNLQKENADLSSQLAQMSYKLAKVFNASYQYGGAKLLDYLQTEIGLTQSQNGF